jgi:hypothetical protein
LQCDNNEKVQKPRNFLSKWILFDKERN